jgi:type IV secretory pathway VirB2 component (pilin)
MNTLSRWSPLLFVTFCLIWIMLNPEPVQAASAGGGGLPWETPLQKLADSIKGPVAFSISLLGLVGGGAMLIWGGEINEFVRRLVMLVLVISLLVFASNILSTLFGVGAVIG